MNVFGLAPNRLKLGWLLICGLPLFVGGCGGSSSTKTAPPGYQIADLGVLPGDGVSSASALNSKGQVVGSSISPTGISHAFLYSGSGLIGLGTLPGGTTAQASGINTAGQVVGVSDTSAGFNHAFLYSNGMMQDLGVLPGDTLSYATGINSQGQVAGYSQIPPPSPVPENLTPSPTHAFVYTGTALTGLGALPGDASSFAFAINDQGQVAGASFTSSGPERAFLSTGGVLKDLGTPSGMYSSATGVNSKGQVVGTTGVFVPAQAPPVPSSTPQYAFLYSGTTPVSLGTLPGDTDSVADAVNDSGQVVGRSSGAGVDRAFLYSNGVMKDLTSLLPAGSGWTLTEATEINNTGQICGTGQHNNMRRAFLLTPQ